MEVQLISIQEKDIQEPRCMKKKILGEDLEIYLPFWLKKEKLDKWNDMILEYNIHFRCSKNKPYQNSLKSNHCC